MMLRNENIICISSIDWDFIWQGHQEIMVSFAKNGNRVLFIENTGVRVPGIRDIARIKNRIKNWFRGVKGIRQEMDNLYIFSPLVLPFPYSRIARWINRHLILSIVEKWMKIVDFTDPIIWTFLPTPLSSDIAESFVRKLFIYYCIDNLSVSSMSAKKIKHSETDLLKKVDLVFVTSKGLYDYCSRYNGKVYNFPFAVNFEAFEAIRSNDTDIPEELREIKPPIIGYIGGVHKWIDQDLVIETLKRRQDYSFVFIGPVQTDIALFSSYKNIHFLGQKDHKKLPLFIKYFDACIIPYLITEYTKNVYPTKLNEYLAMGKPVISTDLPEIMAFEKRYKGSVYVAALKKSFAESIHSAISEDNESLRKNRIEVARQNSWSRRIEDMSNLIEVEIEKKKIDRQARWRESMTVFYRRARRRILAYAGTCVFLYMLLFKTSFIWFLASPLKIVDVPLHADVILVFGGGVGETGNPGKSTIERSRYAVELYKQGFADKIIFSSGYTYIYNDAENMRLFALSMAVPGEDIILEQKANSTYENVVFSKDILDRNKWDSILLVSSLYNMRRASLVFNKWGKGIKVLHAPVKHSQFYDRSEGVKFEQIRAIMHEYLGIIYYWVKRYI